MPGLRAENTGRTQGNVQDLQTSIKFGDALKSEGIKGGSIGQVKGSQTKQERLPNFLRQPEAPSSALDFVISVLLRVRTIPTIPP